MEPQSRADMVALDNGTSARARTRTHTHTHSRTHSRNNDGTSTNSSTQIQTKRTVKNLSNILRCVWTGSVHTTGHVQTGHGHEQTHQNTGTEFFPHLWQYRQRSITLPWKNRNRTVSVIWADSERTVSGQSAYWQRNVSVPWSEKWA